MENSKLPYLQDLRKLTIPTFAYPFIIKGHKYLNDNEKELNTFYNILEIVVFRHRLINSRADFISRLNEILLAFRGNLIDLKIHFKNKLNESWYWGDYRLREYLSGYMYDNRVLNYLLWKYEDSIQNKGYNIGSCEIENEQIEHISPRKPANGEPLATGYDVDDNNQYEETFKISRLYSIGNLMLISGSHNASIGNKSFSEKLSSYKSNPLLKQQLEIASFLDNDTIKWGTNEISKRQNKIVEFFAIPKWSFNSIKIE